MKFKAIPFSDTDHNGRCTGDSMFIPEYTINCDRTPTFDQLSTQFKSFLVSEGFGDEDIEDFMAKLSGFWIVSNAQYNRAVNIGDNVTVGSDSALYMIINMIKTQLDIKAVNTVTK